MATQLTTRARRATRVSRKGLQPASKQDVKQVVKSILGQSLEHKRANLLLPPTVVNTTGNIYCLTQFVTEGDGISQRTGRVINMEQVVLRYRRVLDTTSANSGFLRTIVFLDTQNQGAVPSLTDVLTALDVSSGYEVLNAQQNRFRILLDDLESLTIGGANLAKTSVWNFNQKIQVHYGGAADAAASNRRNAVFFLELSDKVTLGPQTRLGVQLKFTDA